MFEVTNNQINLIIDERKIGYILFDEKEDYIVGSYIFVNPEDRGKGYTNDLMAYFVKFSNAKSKKIMPTCPVIKRILESSYKEVLK